jgi:hypothetical protein
MHEREVMGWLDVALVNDGQTYTDRIAATPAKIKRWSSLRNRGNDPL